MQDISKAEFSLIEQYARCSFHTLKKEGLFRAEYDDIYQQFSIVLCKAKVNYDENKENIASLKTYIVKAFQNAIFDYKEEIMTLPVEITDHEVDNFIDEGDIGAENQLLEHEAEEVFINSFKGIDKIIVSELISPSDKVVLHIQQALKEQADSGRPYKNRNGNLGKVYNAISDLYSIPIETIKYRVRKIKKKALFRLV